MKITIVLILLTFGSVCASAQTEPTVEIPNVFTPNGDGVNDLFKVKSSGYSHLKCTIFNRYGEIMYVFYGLNGSWDGRTHAGLRCPDGVYFYVLDIGLDTDEIDSFQGKIHLFSGTDKPN